MSFEPLAVSLFIVGIVWWNGHLLKDKAKKDLSIF